MKKILFTIKALALVVVLHAQTWTVLTTSSNSNLKGIHFPTATTGYAVGDNGTILKTINGGTTWTNLTTAFPGYWFWDVHFVNVDTGYVVGESNPGSNPCGLGIALKTTNGGTTWTTLFSGSSTPVRDLFVLDKDTVFICGGAEQNSSRIAKSFDGGTSWNQIGITYNDAMLGGLYLLKSNYGFLGVYESVFGTYNPGLATWLNTSNGTTFTSNVIPLSISYWNFASDFPDASNGYFTRSTYAGSDSVYLRKTIDGGATWNESAIHSFVGSIYGLDFIDAATGYIVGAAGVIRKTVNGGLTWSQQTSPTTEELRSVCFVNSTLGYAAGANGTIIKYEATAGIPETNSSSESVTIYPNPALEQFTLEANSDLLGSFYTLTDLTGKIIYTAEINSKNTVINISELSTGMYFLNLNGQIYQTIKVIKK